MKLSEAIREGAKLRPQCFGNYFEANERDQLCSCALGAAHEALHHSVFDPYDDVEVPGTDEVCAEFEGIDHEATAIHPVSGNSMYLGEVVMDLNDEERWPREKIADWVESIGL